MRRITVHSVMCTMDIQTTLLRLVLLHQLLTKFAIVSGFWIILEDGPLLKTQLFICFLSSYLVLLVHVFIFWHHFDTIFQTSLAHHLTFLFQPTFPLELLFYQEILKEYNSKSHLVEAQSTVDEALLAEVLGNAMQIQHSLLDLGYWVLRGDRGQFFRWEHLRGVFYHALCVVVAQLCTGADDCPPKPFVKDLQHRKV